MTRPLIIGFGNPLRQDDGLGWRAAQLLQARADDAAEVLTCHQLTPELAAKLSGARLAIFLDASVDQPPGTIRERVVQPAGCGSFSHHLSPAELLGLARRVNHEACTAVLITGGIFEAGFGDRLTQSGEECAARMAESAWKILPKIEGAPTHAPGARRA